MEPGAVDVIKGTLPALLGEYSWLFIVGLVALFFKSTIESSVAGLMVFLGNDYNDDDVILLDGRPGRIVRVTAWKSTFYLYKIVVDENGKKIITGGTKLVVENSKLKDLKLERPLINIDLTQFGD